MNMLRVNYDDLDLDEWGNHFWEGVRFTGVSYELYDDGQLRFEGEYENGYLVGAYHEWYPSRRLQSEGYIAKMGERERGSWQREWFENGQLKLEKSYNRLSGHVIERKWNEQGELIYEYERPTPDQHP
jgi:antitoxin component YwqK of YwqJK toxin-antitoxin module